jgi:quinoprotein glucose dehydrogenase
VELVTGTLVRRLEAEPRTGRIVRATGNATDASGEPVTFVANTFVLAAGYVWTPHLLLLSRDAAHPEGLANRSGLVGRYVAGHRNVNAYVRLPLELYPGLNAQHSLVSKKFMRPAGRQARYLRHDLRIWESSEGREPRLRGDPTSGAGQAPGALLLGDALLADWRARASGATARVRAYYDVLPDRESRITLDADATNRFGDPMPRVAFRDAPESAEQRRGRRSPSATCSGRWRAPAVARCCAWRTAPTTSGRSTRAADAAWATIPRRASWIAGDARTSTRTCGSRAPRSTSAPAAATAR